MQFYRNGIRACLFVGGVLTVLLLLCLAVWGALALAHDFDGSVVARTLALICAIAGAIDLVVLVVLLARLQLIMLEAEEPE